MPVEIIELTMRDYDEALALWQRAGWVERADVRLMSRTMSASPMA